MNWLSLAHAVATPHLHSTDALLVGLVVAAPVVVLLLVGFSKLINIARL
jgi:hypothetical protein